MGGKSRQRAAARRLSVGMFLPDSQRAEGVGVVPAQASAFTRRMTRAELPGDGLRWYDPSGDLHGGMQIMGWGLG